MVKQNSSRHLDYTMNEYKMRTSHSGPMNSSRSNPSQHNRVHVAHSNGCCSSKQPPRPVHMQQTQTQIPHQPQPHQQTAHERSHSKLDTPDPFYYRHGRIKKTPHRTKKPYHSQYGKNQVHSSRPTNLNQNYQPPPPKTKNSNCCCTIL